MQSNLLLHQRALFLRVKKGYSYNEIIAEIPVSKSTLSEWLGHITLSPKQIERIKEKGRLAAFHLGEWNRQKRQDEIMKIRTTSAKEIPSLTDDQFFVAGIMLYWAEGDKGGKQVQISNADPILIKFIMEWFRTRLHITEDRFTASIHYHQGQDFHSIEKFWSDIAKIPLQNFRKPFCKPPGTGHRKHYLHWGVFRIRIKKSANLFHQIIGWRNGLIQARISGINIK